MQAGVLLDITSKINRLPSDEESEIDNTNTNTTEITLNVNDTFEDWNAVNVAVNMYAKQNGFVATKYRKDLDEIDKTIIRHWVYRCWKGGEH